MRKYALLIQARAGSKRVVGKNMRLCGGKPLLEWNLIAATNCKYIDRVFLSTDGEDMKALAESYGVTVFNRPKQFFYDHAGGGICTIHGIKKMQEVCDFTHLVTMFPTSPMITGKHLTDGITKFNTYPTAEALCCLYPIEKSVSYLDHIKILVDGMMVNIFGLHGQPIVYSQLKYYFTNGGFGIHDITKMNLANKEITDDMNILDINELYKDEIRALCTEGIHYNTPTILGFEITKEDALDINTEFDIKLANLLISEREANNGRRL